MATKTDRTATAGADPAALARREEGVGAAVDVGRRSVSEHHRRRGDRKVLPKGWRSRETRLRSPEAMLGSVASWLEAIDRRLDRLDQRLEAIETKIGAAPQGGGREE